MSARNDTITLQKRLNDNGIPANWDDANTLRRAQITLHRWHEQECGDGNEYSSWSIERDEKTQKPYRCVYPHSGPMRRYPIADKERGAIARVERLCWSLRAKFYVQTDPRGCSLYVSMEKLTDQNYSSRGVACAS